MTRWMRRACVAAAITLGLLASATAAQASSGFSFSQTRIGVSGTVTFNALFTCDYLFELALTGSTIPKTGTIGTLSGSGSSCRGTSFTSSAVLGPIPVVFKSFAGVLPSIASIRVDIGTVASPMGFGFADSICRGLLFGGAVDPVWEDVDLTIAGGVLSGLDLSASRPWQRNAGPIFCMTALTPRGTLRAFLAPGAPSVALV